MTQVTNGSESPDAGAAPAGDRCPGILRPHQAEDGALLRLRLPGGRIGAGGLRAVAEAAELGNRLVELTSRASLQLRGFDLAAAARAEAILDAAGLIPSPAHDRVRNIVACPLGGRGLSSVCATDDVVAELDRGLCADPALTALPGRFLFCVDDGTGELPASRADVLVRAAGPGTFTVAPTGVTVPAQAAAAAALDAARELLQASRGSQAPEPEAPIAVGVRPQRDGRCAVSALPPLGRVSPVQLRALASLAERLGTDVRVSSRRTVTIVDVDVDDGERVQAELEDLGLIAEPGSGWVGLSACSGLGACSKALVDVRAVATLRAEQRTGSGEMEHWVACERGCGTPAGLTARGVDAAIALLAS